MRDKIIKFLSFDKTRSIALALAILIGLVFVVLYKYTNLLANMESGSIDFRFYMRAPEQRSEQIMRDKIEVKELNTRVHPDIAIIGVDEASISQLGSWPWPWSLHGDLIQSLNMSANVPSAILFDIFFIDHKTLFSRDAEKVLKQNLSGNDIEKVLSFNTLNEERLSRSIANTNNVFLDYPFFSEKTKTTLPDFALRLKKLHEISWKVPNSDIQLPWVQDVVPPLYKIAQNAAGIGYANIRYEERENVNRRMPLVVKYKNRYYPGIDLVLAMKYFNVSKENVDIRLGDGIYLKNIPKKLINANSSRSDKKMVLQEEMKIRLDRLFAYRFSGKADTDKWGKAIGYPGYAPEISFSVEHGQELSVRDLTIQLVSLSDPKAKKIQLLKVDKFLVDKEKKITLGKDIILAFHPTKDQNQTSILKITSDLGSVLQGELIKKDIMVKPNAQRQIRIPVDIEGFMAINFAGGQESFASYSFHDFVPKPGFSDSERKEHFENFKQFDSFEGKVLLVAIYKALGLVDVHKSPYGPMFGIEHHANALNTIMNQDFLYILSQKTNIMIMIIIALLFGFWLPRVSIIKNAVISFLSLIAFFAFAQIAFNNYSIVSGMATPLLQITFTFTGITVFRVMTEEKKSKYIRSTFSKFVSKAVVNELLSDPDKIQLGGEDLEITVFFSDIRGFTTISEALTAQQLVALLNEYLTEMTDMLIEEKGTLDKYMGDAIMAFWGAPLPMEDHALRACRCSLAMYKSLHVMQERWVAEGRPPIDIGIGLNTGIATVGNIGSTNRMEYTCMGDTINLGSRLEGINKFYGTNIIISEFTYAKVKDHVIARELDLIRVKGKNEPVRIYELLAMKDEG